MQGTALVLIKAIYVLKGIGIKENERGESMSSSALLQHNWSKTYCRGMEMFIYSRTCSKHIWILWLWLWKPLVFHNDSNHRAKNSGLVRIYNLIINSGRIFQNNETDLFVEKPLTAMVFWRKPLTILSCSKFNHCCGLMCAKYKQVRYPWQEL